MGNVGHEALAALFHVGKLKGHAVDLLAQRLQFAAAGKLYAAVEPALGKVAHGGGDLVERLRQRARQQQRTEDAEDEYAHAHGQERGQYVHKAHAQILRGDVEQHRAHHVPVAVAPRHADGDDVLAQFREQALHADLVALIDAGDLRKHRLAGDVAGIDDVAAAVQELVDEAAVVVADDPDIGVVMVVDGLHLGKEHIAHGAAFKDELQLIEVRHIARHLARLRAHLVLVGSLPLRLQRGGEDEGEQQHRRQRQRQKAQKRAQKDAAARPVAVRAGGHLPAGVAAGKRLLHATSPRICSPRPTRS